MRFNFDCVFYYVSDMKNAVSFYANVLGLKLVSWDVVARFDIDGTQLEIVPAPEQAKLRGGGNARLCLQVDNIDQALKALQARGVRTSGVQAKEGGLLASFQDPDGNEICLWQKKPRYVGDV